MKPQEMLWHWFTSKWMTRQERCQSDSHCSQTPPSPRTIRYNHTWQSLITYHMSILTDPTLTCQLSFPNTDLTKNYQVWWHMYVNQSSDSTLTKNYQVWSHMSIIVPRPHIRYELWSHMYVNHCSQTSPSQRTMRYDQTCQSLITEPILTKNYLVCQ